MIRDGTVEAVWPTLMPVKTVADVRDRARAGVRDVVLDAAREVTIDQGWRAVRIGALATQVGLSRQSVHLVFGTKAQLGSDLVHREIDQLLTGIGAALDAHPGDPLACIREAATVTLTSMAENPLLQIIISGGGDEDLLALLTSRGDWILRQATELLHTWAARELPDVEPARIASMAEPVVRLCLSHGVTPTQPIPDAADSLVRISCLLIGLPDPGP